MRLSPFCKFSLKWVLLNLGKVQTQTDACLIPGCFQCLMILLRFYPNVKINCVTNFKIPIEMGEES